MAKTGQDMKPSEVTKRYWEFRNGLGPLKTQEDLLTTNLENRHEVQHHNHKKHDMPLNHIPSGKVFRPETSVIPKPRKKYYKPIIHEAREGEVPLKVWLANESEATGKTTKCLYTQIVRGKLPHLILRHVNSRVCFVRVPNNFEI